MLESSANSDIENVATACAFCNVQIPFGQSLCSDCMNKFNIRVYDLGNDGCGCDR